MGYVFTAVLEKRKKWYIGYVEELPGANAQGRTLKEVKRNLKEAVKLILGTNILKRWMAIVFNHE